MKFLYIFYGFCLATVLDILIYISCLDSLKHLEKLFCSHCDESVNCSGNYCRVRILIKKLSGPSLVKLGIILKNISIYFLRKIRTCR